MFFKTVLEKVEVVLANAQRYHAMDIPTYVRVGDAFVRVQDVMLQPVPGTGELAVVLDTRTVV